MNRLIYFAALPLVVISIIIVISTSLKSVFIPAKSYADDCFTINGETIDANTNTRPFVCFQHDAHNEKAALENCDRCHHVYDKDEKLIQGESSESQSCRECHAGNINQTDLNNSNSDKVNKLNIKLTAKYHKLCRECHISEKKGPVVCGECHKK